MTEPIKSFIYEFDDFRLDTATQKLFRRETGELVSIQPKALELLLLLIENEGQILTREEILETLWAENFVEEANLTQTVFVLRKTLGEDKNERRFIITVPHRGYRFIGKIERDAEISKTENQNQKTEDRKPHSTKYFFIAVPLILLFAVGIFYLWRETKPDTVRDVKSIAVLPFEDLSEEQTEKYLGISLTDALVNKFGELKNITVRPTRTVLKYADSREDLSKIGRELQVDAVIDGRIQRVGEKIRVSVQLIRTADSATIWTEKFDDNFTNFFAVQDSISQKVVQSLALQMNEKERERFSRRGTENADAYQDYLRGRYFWNKRTIENLNKAVSSFEKAVEKDPNFALAYSGLADSYILLSEYHAAAPHEIFPKVKAALKKALELDDQSAEVHTSLGYMKGFYDWDFAGAENSFKRALELNPNYATAHQWYGEFIAAFGRFEEARQHHERAAQIEPVSPILHSALAGLYDIEGDYENVIRQSQKILEIDPNFAYGYFHLAMGYERKGMEAEASEALIKALTLFGEPPETAEEVRQAFKKNGLKGWWQKRLEQVENRPHLKNFQAYFKALIEIRLGDKEGALRSLNRAFERRDHYLIYAKHEQRLAPLRDDPRFQELLRRIGLT